MPVHVRFNSPISRVVNGVYYPAWTHESLLYWSGSIQEIRDCVEGEVTIKRKGAVYLPPLERMNSDDYQSFVDRATWFGFVDRTLSAMVGSLFMRAPKITGVPSRLDSQFKRIARDGMTLDSFLSNAVEEVITSSRYGLLLDMDEGGEFPPYVVGYRCEDILDWRVQVIESREELTYVVLREMHDIAPKGPGEIRQFETWYRVLSIEEDGIYRQALYKTALNGNLNSVTPEIIVPTNRGMPFRRIPMKLISAKANSWSFDRPPLAALTSLQLAHYRDSALLEQSLYFASMPVWYVNRMPGAEEAEYFLGSSVVWEVGPGEKCGVVELNGQSVENLRKSCRDKEDQAALIGARFLGGYAQSTSESDNQARIKESNERALLATIARNVGEAMSEICSLWAQWQDVPNAAITVALNTDFLATNIGARELRAIQALFKDSIIPIEVVFDYLQKAEVIPEWIDFTTFTAMLRSPGSFPSQPDALARLVGFQTAKDLHDFQLATAELKAAPAMIAVN